MYAWRTWACDGGLLLEQRFDTPADAGRWRREKFGPDHSGLTLKAVDDGETLPVTSDELCAAHFAWQCPDLQDESATARVGPPAA